MIADRKQTCAQFDSRGGCRLPSEVVTYWDGRQRQGYALDFCAMHNHMAKTGVPVKCWRCGDDRLVSTVE